jgi:Kef-type K+ transport system membrane component KefB
LKTGVAQLDFFSVFFAGFILASCLLTAASILVGWVSIKTSLRQFSDYDDRLFVINVLGILCLFMINNVIMFSFGATYSISSFTSFVLPTQLRADVNVTSTMAASVYLLNALYLLLCKLWNVRYYTLRKSEGDRRYERLLSFIILVQLSCAFSALLIRVPSAMSATLAVYIVSWVGVHWRWIVTELRKPVVPDLSDDGV